jgi:RecA-family ATPase|tara:strand:- start:2351 stop:3217 length:867 start_codon:yes stop_codon:yes gene_type:complete
VSRKYQSLSELLSWRPPHIPDIISNGVLSAGSRLVIFGDPKSWKSFEALHLTFCLASGLDWYGFKTSKCIVYSLQSELTKYHSWQRTMQYCEGLLKSTGDRDKAYPSSSVYFRTDNYLHLDSSFGLNNVKNDLIALRAAHPDEFIVLILDPLYLLMGGRISDEYDIKKFLVNMNILTTEYNLSLIILHHTRKSHIDASGHLVKLGAEEATGNRYLSNWCDTMIQLTLLNPYGAKNKVRMDFVLSRHAKDVLPRLDIRWDRKMLQPSVVGQELHDSEDVTIREYDEEVH